MSSIVDLQKMEVVPFISLYAADSKEIIQKLSAHDNQLV